MSWKIALQVLQQGRIVEAMSHAEAACRSTPDDPMAWHIAGLVTLKSGAHRSAVGLLTKAVQMAPHATKLRGPLGVALVHTGQTAQAREHLNASAGTDPWLRLYQGIAAFAQRDSEHAVHILAPLADEKPADPTVWRYLGLAALDTGRLPLAAVAWENTSELLPNDPESVTMLGMVRGRQGNAALAIQCFHQAIERDPNHLPAWSQLGMRQLQLGEFEAAEKAFVHAKDNVGLALLAERRRDLNAARSMIEPIVNSGKASEAALDLWARLCRRQKTPEAALPPLRQALQQRPELERAVLLHALADTLDAVGAVDEAWSAWKTANDVRQHSFDPQAHQDLVGDTISAWSSVPVTRGPAGHAPIFIVGIPRSGTSLLEQMLNTHPMLRGIGEREDIPHLASRLGVGPITDPNTVMAAAEEYRTSVGRGRTVDKMPHNFYHLGLIWQLFPDARILYSVRDPEDTCFSCFRQRFTAGMAYTTRLSWLGMVYANHVRLMTHWTNLGLPILPVPYSQLVQQPEETLRGVLSWLDVPWDPDCLRFHEQDRLVATASFEQVQRPVYTHSLGRSKPYRHHLSPLRAALAEGPSLNPV